MERKGCVVELLRQQHQRDTSSVRRESSSSSSSSSSSVVTRLYSDSIQAVDSKISRHDQLEAGDKKMTIADMQFPWKSEFRKQCSSSILSHGPSSLITLIKLFKRNVSSNVNDCYKKSSRAAKLKELIKEVLLLFVYFHRFEQPQDLNRAVYLEHMSDLLAMYIDVELVASKRDVEPQHGKISARLVSCLYVYLEKSTEHMLDTLIKIQLMNETYCLILDSVISKIFQMIPAKPESELMYVRYLLVYRLWKKVHSNLAVKKQINASALSSLGMCPDNLPATLLAEVLPAATAASASLSKSQTTRFYLCQHFDLRRACSNFLRYCRQSRGEVELDSNTAAGFITERDQRLKSTITSATNKVESLNNGFSKCSNAVEKSSSLKNVMNIPFAKLEINSSKTSSSIGSNCVENKKVEKSVVPRKHKSLKEKLDEIAFIDLTDEEVTKIVKRKKEKRIDWLEDVKDVKRLAALKKERDEERKQKERDFERIFEEEIKVASRRSNGKSVSVEPVELVPKSYSAPNTDDIHSKSDKGKLTNERIVDSVEPADPKTNPMSSPPPISSISKLVCHDNDSVTDRCDHNEMSVASVTSPKVASESGIREEKVSALHDSNYSLKDNQPADSTVSNAMQEEEASSPSGEKANCSVIREHPRRVDAAAGLVAENAKPKRIMEKPTVNFKSTNSDNYPNERRVQAAATLDRKDNRESSSADEAHPSLEKPKDKDNKSVNNKKVRAKCNRKQESQSANIGVKQLEAGGSSAASAAPNGYYDIPESDIDGLTLLASVSAQQRLTASKKIEIKVKPYTSLQQKPKEEDSGSKPVTSHIVGMYPEDCLDKVALQMEVSSTEAVSSTVNKSELLSYIIDETIQNNLESNDNANVILNGETVMLLQKSPNSNLYIINKAAVDSLSNSKLNYNSDEEDTAKLAEYEDTKCTIKHDPDEVGQRGRAIKPDPDYADIKSSALIGHDDSKLPSQPGYELHYAGYPVAPPASYCTYASIHHPSTGCACVSCAYCRQLPFYLPASHATQSVQTNSSVQEKRSKQKTDAAMLAKFYDEKIHSAKEMNLLDGKEEQQQQQQQQHQQHQQQQHQQQQQQQQQQQAGEGKQALLSRYNEHVDYYLPTAAHPAPTVQINPAVQQEKRSNKQPDGAVKSANHLYDDQLHSSLEKHSSDKQIAATERKASGSAASKFEQLGSTLPLKKRLKAQRMLMDSRNREVILSLKNKAVLSVYPADVMVAVTEFAEQSHDSPLDLGAVVEVTSALAKPAKSRATGRKEKSAMNTKINNQNVPNCFPRKAGNKKKRLGSTDEEVENSGVSAPKKARKSNDGRAKQTRSSRRIVPTVNYVYPEIDTECNPSGKRKKKRNNRSSTTAAKTS